MTETSGFLPGPHGRIAWRRRAGDAPAVVWLGGFVSDMMGTKAEALSEWAARTGRAFLRFDYSGHGASDGRFEDGTISAWLDDCLAAIDGLTEGPLVLVGSSMGGWIATLAALRRKDRIAGLVLIAPAADFTEALLWDHLTGPERDMILREGRLVEHSPYSPAPTIITRALIEDGRNHLLLDAPIDVVCPVRILQGMADDEVPWRHALRLAERLVTDDLEFLLIKSGDHRLSKPREIAKIVAAIESVGAGYAARGFPSPKGRGGVSTR